MTAATCTRKPASKPVSRVSWRWIEVATDTRTGLAEINGEVYAVAVSFALSVAYLTKCVPGGKSYRLELQGGGCQCRDHEFRPRPEGCKHRIFVREAFGGCRTCHHYAGSHKPCQRLECLEF